MNTILFLLKRKKNEIIISFLYTFILGIIAYGYVFSQFTPSHDGVMTITHDQEWQTSLGRHLAQFYIKIRGPVDSPWLIGIITLFF